LIKSCGFLSARIMHLEEQSGAACDTHSSTSCYILPRTFHNGPKITSCRSITGVISSIACSHSRVPQTLDLTMDAVLHIVYLFLMVDLIKIDFDYDVLWTGLPPGDGDGVWSAAGDIMRRRRLSRALSLQSSSMV
jgi:hypothetical protein